MLVGNPIGVEGYPLTFPHLTASGREPQANPYDNQNPSKRIPHWTLENKKIEGEDFSNEYDVKSSLSIHSLEEDNQSLKSGVGEEFYPEVARILRKRLVQKGINNSIR